MAIYRLYNDAWSLACLYDQAGNVVQFNTLIGGETGFEHEAITQEHTAGDYQSGYHNVLNLASPEYDGAPQLQTWKLNNTPVAAVALSTQLSGRNYRWTEFVKLSQGLNQPKGQRSEGDSFLKAVLDHYDVHPIRKRNLADGVTPASMVLPVAGVTLTLAAEKGTSFSLTLTAKDKAGTQLDNATSLHASERGSVSLQLPAKTWEVVWNDDGGSKVSLRADGSSKYVGG